MILNSENNNKINLSRFSSHFEREPLIKPFGFKGNIISNDWKVAVMLESDEGGRRVEDIDRHLSGPGMEEVNFHIDILDDVVVGDVEDGGHADRVVVGNR